MKRPRSGPKSPAREQAVEGGKRLVDSAADAAMGLSGAAHSAPEGPAGGELPSEAELYRRYARFRRQYFDDLTPPVETVTIQWSRRLTGAAGKCYSGQKIIRLSTHYHLKYPGDVDKTLLHEMIHLLVPNHGPDFYEWMERIRRRGGQVERYAKERATPKVYRWEYTCRGCGVKGRRQRRLPGGGVKYRCKTCGGTLAEARLPHGKEGGSGGRGRHEA